MLSKDQQVLNIREVKKKVKEITLQSGDSIVLNTGHGIKVLEPTEIIELKQGPYRGRELEKKYIK